MRQNIFKAIFFVMVFSTSYAGSVIYESTKDSRYERTGTITIDSTADSLAGGFIKTSGETFTLGKSEVIKSLNGAFIIDSSTEDARGFGWADTAVAYLETISLGFAATILDSVRQLGLPCTLWVDLANVNDTLFKEYIQITWAVYDTSAADSLEDSIGTIDPYNMRWYMIGRD